MTTTQSKSLCGKILKNRIIALAQIGVAYTYLQVSVRAQNEEYSKNALLSNILLQYVSQNEKSDAIEGSVEEAEQERILDILRNPTERTFAETDPEVFRFLEVATVRIPQKDLPDEAEINRALLLDAKKARLLKILLDNGSAKQLTPTGIPDKKATEFVNKMILSCIANCGSQTLKVVLDAIDVKVLRQETLNGGGRIAAKRSWLFPEAVGVMMRLGCQSEVREGDEDEKSIINLMARTALVIQVARYRPTQVQSEHSRYEKAINNINTALRATLEAQPGVPIRAARLAISGAWVEGLRTMVENDTGLDPQELQETLVQELKASPKFPNAAKTGIEEIFEKLRASQDEALKSFERFSLFFSAATAESGNELWFSDGTRSGTRQILDINPGQKSSDPVLFGILNSRLIIEGYGAGGVPRWIAMALDSGAVTDLIEPTDWKERTGVVSFSDGYLLRLNQAKELWQTDGTKQGTVPVAPDKLRAENVMRIGTSQSLVLGHHGEIYLVDLKQRQFREFLINDERNFDYASHAVLRAVPLGQSIILQTRTGTLFRVPMNAVAEKRPLNWSKVSKLYQGKLLADLSNGYVISKDGFMYFCGKQRESVGAGRFADTYGWELYRVGTDGKAELVVDLVERKQDDQGAKPMILGGRENAIMMLASKSNGGEKLLWCFNGEFTDLLHSSIEPDPSKYCWFNGNLYFTLKNAPSELWMSDSTKEGTKRIRTFPGQIKSVVSCTKGMVCATKDDGLSLRLWRSDAAANRWYALGENLNLSIDKASDTVKLVLSEIESSLSTLEANKDSGNGAQADEPEGSKALQRKPFSPKPIE